MTVRANVYLIHTIFSIQQKIKKQKKSIKYEKCYVFIDKPVI